jgi:transcriptional regulator with XRE-family HTH domain
MSLSPASPPLSISLYHADYERLRGAMRGMRMAAGFSQVALAQQLGLGQSYVSKLERGENFVDVLLYLRWCAACGVQAGARLDELFAVAGADGAAV